MSQRSGSFELPPEAWQSLSAAADRQAHQQPQRLSALYQYHNAPEVAPAHGLEYDDSNYPHSDKYPVIHSVPAYDSKWNNKGFSASDDGKPPRIIFGMKVPTFLIVASVMILVIVGAAVGGAVGGSTIKNANAAVQSSQTSTPDTFSSTSASTTPTISATAASSYAAATPTYTPIGDCPAANNTIYTSVFASGSYGTVQPATRLNFTRYCNVADPLSWNNQNILLGIYAYSFEDCIEACAGLNFYNNNGNCQLVGFQSSGSRPVNCWIGSYNTSHAALKPESGTSVALLHL